ncbi:toll/interleukin-1 receptor domain-containing protein [Pseudomonas knackmussii]|uniref:Toll/interleukin-1 receptor domain-containing protein n=1 Tax=Pseudomonas knackmussii TaxID=65741 RepID=A0ABY4KLU3_9PSED|nr:toll/interleukin-1 receptor domain-containing protein [Pseudomonas knackmussii]UPQ81800.1 toll/interleukin-1 receptor domain-containing protein [Pseudomonas knackmussii]
MSKSIFISYSHKDELHREDLEEHLSMLRREGIIEVWHDRKITAGSEWKNVIDENLDSAEIIIFLISPSFLASDYCHDIELKRALERHESGLTKIVSIIVRACDWQSAGFAKFQALPKDALPITLWSDRDSAWLDAVRGLRSHMLESIAEEKKSLKVTDQQHDSKAAVSPEQAAWLDDTEIVLTHRKADKIKLGDIYVYPDIELESENKKKSK